MNEVFVLDTSAFISLTDREAGWERVQELLKAAQRLEVSLHASFVSLTEIRYILTYDRGEEKANRILSAILRFPVRWHHSDDYICEHAAKLKVSHKLSLADCFVAALAQGSHATLLHKDPEFQSLEGVVKLETLPPKGGQAVSR